MGQIPRHGAVRHGNCSYLRAVRGNCAKKTWLFTNDNFVSIDNFLTPWQLIIKSSIKTILKPFPGLPRNQPARMANPSASLFFCFNDNSCLAQLTSNTDGIIQKLVTVFAIRHYSLLNAQYRDFTPAPPISASLRHRGAIRSYPFLNLFTTWYLYTLHLLCTATLLELNTMCIRLQKRVPYLPCTMTNSWLKNKFSAWCCGR